MKSLESSRGRGCLHNCVVVDLVKSISLDRLKGPGTLTGGGSGGQGKAQLLQFWFQEKFGLARSVHLQVESEHWELGSCQST